MPLILALTGTQIGFIVVAAVVVFIIVCLIFPGFGEAFVEFIGDIFDGWD